MAKRWTEEEKQFLIKNYEFGLTKEIAVKLNRSESSLHKIANELGLEKKQYHRKSFYDAKLANLICIDYKNGLSITSLSKKYKISQHYIKLWLIKNNLIDAILRKGKFPLVKNKWNMPFNNNHKLWQGYGELPKTFFTKIKFTAKKRNLEFNITIEYIWNLFLEQNRKCKLSNKELVFYKKCSNKTIQTASLDRIDSSKGYIEGNVQWVHVDVNFMKGSLSQNDFIQFCKEIAKHN